LTTTYAAEVMPVPLRCYLTTYVNLCWVFGQLIASGVLRGMLSRTDQYAYRIPFALQWMWPVPIIIGCILAPESPWWCIRKGFLDRAKHNLVRLTSANRDPNFNADDTVAMMIHTNELEKEISSGTTYLDCFKGSDLRRSEIACIVWAIQNLCGSAFMGYSTYFYTQAGLSTTYSFDMSMAQYALGACGTVGSWFMMSGIGRRKLYLFGLVALFGMVLLIGILGVPAPTPGLSWAIGSMLLIYTFTYDLTIGPVCYSLVAELPSVRLRQKTIVLARNFYNVWGIINQVWTPYMLNPSAWNWGAKTGFFWAGWCFLCLIWTYFRLPEPKGRTYGELDILFENKVSARKFATTDATQFHGQTLRLASVSESAKGDSYDHKEASV
jgi:MFS transporter, SP family, general alpha glucoside:H+ symporter